MPATSPLPYGSWPSTITARSLVAGATGIGELVTSTNPESGVPELWWAESRPEESGRTAIMRLSDGETVEISPPEANVRTAVHEYGGGAWWADAGTLWYSDYRDHRLWKLAQTSGDATEPVPLSPVPLNPGGLRYADGRPTPDGSAYICVRELHAGEPGHLEGEPRNEIVAVAADGSLDVSVLVSGPDFVANPRISCDGTKLCWVQWNHPDMPWDHTELWVADLDGSSVSNARSVLNDPVVAVVQPDWTTDGALMAVGEVGEWWNLLRWSNGPDAPFDVIDPHDGEVGTPPWVFAMSRWADPVGGGPISASTSSSGEVLRHADSGQRCESFSAISQVRPWGSGVVFVGATWGTESGIFSWDPISASATVATLRPARSLPHDERLFPAPEHITFTSADGGEAHALWYAPAHPEHVGNDGERPPLIVKAHGGPTAGARRQLQLGHRYWTSRGIGVVDVDYRGSIGYGRTYRHALRGQWGIFDVQDCIAAAEFLADRGDVDRARIGIAGGSAGGFTVLAALQQSDVFSAGASRYGVADLSALAADTHKFEARYLDRLIGPWPDAEEIYRERSPIEHTDQLRCPMILLQGELDKVVPPNQADLMIAALEGAGLPHAYVSFPDEGHGFRSADNIVTALESELAFFATIFDFEPADSLPPLSIRRP